VPSLGAPVFWAAGYTGAGESVAVMDTGVRTSHPAFSGLNIVSKVFLDYAKQDPCFGDDATSPEDKQGHGTHVAGIVASRGAPGWSNYWGVARGLGTLYNLKIAYLDKCTGGGRFQGNDLVAALNWAVQQAPWVKVINFSSGKDSSGDDDVLARLFDYFADTYGLTISVSAGNESKSGFLGLWTKPGPVSSPGIGSNVITVAAMNTQGTIDRSDDEIAIFSSRGPTVGGRKKPDIAAPGGLRDDWHLSGWQPVLGIWSADCQWDGFRKDSGTKCKADALTS
jgi:serine protease AprX